MLSSLGFVQTYLPASGVRRWSREEFVLPFATLLFLGSLLWYLTVRICLDFAARIWRGKLAAETICRETAETANAVKAEFLSSMSHELRTPLNAIVAFIELGLKTPLPPALHEHLSAARTSAGWLNHIVKDILEFSRIEAGSIKLDSASFSLVDCICAAASIVRPEAEARHLSLKVRVDSDIPLDLRGDSTRLFQVIANLIENGVKFTTCGSVVVSAELTSMSMGIATVRITVTDTGCGIAENALADFFQPLARFTTSPSAMGGDVNHRASAFGLAISRRLVEMMGGHIEVQSRIGAGTTIEVTVSFEVVEKFEPMVQPLETPAWVGRGAGIRILAAAENPSGRQLARSMLEAAGHDVVEASDGRQILPLCEAQHFDLILLDVEMTSLDGFEATRQIRSSKNGSSQTPIFGLTAVATADNRDRCRAVGMNGVLVKPLDVDSLINIAAAIASRPAIQAAQAASS